jgi:cytochrome d ubiquinol oxidase subunit II
MMEALLPGIWLLIIGFFLLYYAVTDGFDLGVGIISLIARNDKERGLMMDSISSIWHTNQTWLVLLGGMLFGAFPLFYGIVFSSLYIPMVVMLLGFVLRGVAFDFREQSETRHVWEVAFGLGSLVATLAEGFALGGLLGGLPVENGKFVGSVWGWFSPFSGFVAAGTFFGFIMLGANYLITKTEGELQQRSFTYALITSGITLSISAGVYVWVAVNYPQVAYKWSNLSEYPFVIILPAMGLFAFGMVFFSLWRRREWAPFLWNMVVVLISFTGLSAALYPAMIPNVIAGPVTVKDAAASTKTLKFMLAMMAVLLPLILVYTAYTYQIFRGKERGDGYGG